MTLLTPKKSGLEHYAGHPILMRCFQYLIEFNTLLNEFIKINPFSLRKAIIPEPYPFRENNITEMIQNDSDSPKYEYSLMTLLNNAFAKNEYTEIFGNYIDFLSYVPTSLGKEMDIVLMYGNKNNQHILSYDIIEVKRDVFDEKALTQLIDYESWFLKKKVSGDLKMLRTTAIAKKLLR